MATVLAHADVLIDAELRSDVSLRIADGKIAALGDSDAIREAGDELIDLSGRIVAPGFVDTQVNGGGGAMFCDQPSLDTLEAMVSAHRTFGTTTMIPTLITSDLATMRKAADAVNRALAEGMPGMAGIHFEGPLLNAERKGVHDARLFRQVEAELVDVLTSIEGGKTIVTLAPEQTGSAFVAELVSQGVIVSLGHTACTYEQARDAFAAGACSMTHLFNAMPPLLSRDPGPIAAALLDPAVYCGLIVDGHHVDPATLRVALAAMGAGRAILVTDAMADVGRDLKDFHLGEMEVRYANGKLTNSDGALAGSALSMIEAVQNAVALAGLPIAEALAAASATPAAMLGMTEEIGAIREGARADLVILDQNLELIDTLVGGQA